MINHRARIEYIQKLLSSRSIDLAIIANSGDIRYLTDYSPFLGDSILVVLQDDIYLINRFEWDRDLSTLLFEENHILSGYDYLSFLKSILPKDHISIAITGKEFLSIDLIEYLTNLDPNLVSIEDVLSSKRLIKSTEEISYLQKAVKITEDAISHAVKTLRKDTTELQMCAEFEYYCKMQGAEELSFPSCIAFAEFSRQVAHKPTDKKIESGQAFFLDVGARYKGYCADIGRTFFVGKPSPEYLDIYNKVLKIHEYMIEYIKVGMHVKDVYKVVHDLFVENGLGEPRHRLGHGVGIETSMEGPDIKYGDETLLENMTFAIEVSHPGTNEGGVKIEDNVYLTKDGCVSFSTSSRELMLIDFGT